jgi:ribose-phosphate pyrophosphokinase
VSQEQSSTIFGLATVLSSIQICNVFTQDSCIDNLSPFAEVMNVIGDVKNKTCIIIDDIIDTAGTLCNAADALKKHGAKKVYAYISHPVLSGFAIEKISKSKLDSLIVTDTIPLSKEAENCKKIKIVSMDSTLAGAITRVNREESISEMFL